jgi:aminoglycoside 6'-N-acetyltransferase
MDDVVSIRPLRDTLDDYELLLRWLTNPQVLEWYEGRDQVFTLERLQREWAPAAQIAEHVWPCIAEYGGRPVGYIQYVWAEPYAKEYQLDGDASRTWAIDLFVGEPDLWGRGIGTSMMRLMIDHIIAEADADRIVIDPRLDNARAVHVYESIGFHKVKVLPAHELHEGQLWDCWLMELIT